MNTRKPILLHMLVAGSALLLANLVTAEIFTVLHSFTGGDDGANPRAGLVLSGNTFYGTAGQGGSAGIGTVFAVHTDGTGLVTLHTFTGSDGAVPRAVILVGDTLYGTTRQGGGSDNGTLFAIKTDGTAFRTLHSFTATDPSTGTNRDGAGPRAGLTLSGDRLYGTAAHGGDSGVGTVFAINTNGVGFTTLHSFIGTDGAVPWARLTFSGTTAFGTTRQGGSSDNGTVFALDSDGSGFATLHSFTATSVSFVSDRDGPGPYGELTLSGNTLYGTASDGGSSGAGAVFALKTDGSDFTTLYSFGPVSDPSVSPYINDDGAFPVAGLVLSGNTLYGTAEVGGSSGAGTVFAVKTDGTGFTNLHTLTGVDGANPISRLILLDNSLYGTASSIFSPGFGTEFRISLPVPQLTITPSGANVVLTWPINNAGFDYTGYTLQSTTSLVSPVWNTISPRPIVIDGQNVVTNSISGTQQFYRLSQ